jgi:hypothetical protein
MHRIYHPDNFHLLDKCEVLRQAESQVTAAVAVNLEAESCPAAFP